MHVVHVQCCTDSLILPVVSATFCWTHHNISSNKIHLIELTLRPSQAYIILQACLNCRCVEQGRRILAPARSVYVVSFDEFQRVFRTMKQNKPLLRANATHPQTSVSFGQNAVCRWKSYSRTAVVKRTIQASNNQHSNGEICFNMYVMGWWL